MKRKHIKTREQVEGITSVQSSPDETDWFEVCLKLLECFSDEEGTYCKYHWTDYGITKEQEEALCKRL